MKVYKLTKEQSQILQSANTSEVAWSPSHHRDVDGDYIAEETLLEPIFSKHKDIFDTFEQPIEEADIDIYSI